MSIAHGGQVLLSRETYELVAPDLPQNVSARDLGAYRLKDIGGPYQLFQLVMPGLPADFPPLPALSSRQPLRNLPAPSFWCAVRKSHHRSIESSPPAQSS